MERILSSKISEEVGKKAKMAGWVLTLFFSVAFDSKLKDV